MPPIVLGATSIDRTNVVFGDFHIFKIWDLEHQSALLIGMDVLGTVEQLIIDFQRGEVYVRT